MALDPLPLLKRLCATSGLSGHEQPTRQIIQEIWQPLADEIGVDRVGSLWAIQRGTAPAPAPRILLAAHMDAIGLLVTKIEGEFLRVTQIGGLDARVLPGQLVTVYGREALPAVVARPPDFLLPRSYQRKVAPVTELLVDTGLSAERLRQLVQVGDVVAFAQPCRELLNGQLAAKSLDNRASVAAVSLCLEQLRQRPHAWEVVAVATVQEEFSFLGATTSAFAHRPDVAVAIDVTFGSDANTKEFSAKTFGLGEGVPLGVGPNIHPGLLAACKAAAERAEIPYSLEPLPGHSGTDADALQMAHAGLPTLTVGIPLRHMHTPVEVVALKDVQRAGRLLAEFIASLPLDFLTTLTLD